MSSPPHACAAGGVAGRGERHLRAAARGAAGRGERLPVQPALPLVLVAVAVAEARKLREGLAPLSWVFLANKQNERCRWANITATN